MASPESIHQLLRMAARLLNQAAEEIRDCELEPVRGNVLQVGRALAEICEVEAHVYAVRPDLKPAFLKEPPQHSEANRRLTQCMGGALELEQLGRKVDAIEKYRAYLATETSEFHREIAQREIERLTHDS